MSACVPREAGFLVTSLSHWPGLDASLLQWHDATRESDQWVNMTIGSQGASRSTTDLRAVAYRMLGSPGDADDAVQEAWFRFSRSDTAGVENLGGWLTTVVGRVRLKCCALAARGARSPWACTCPTRL